MAMQQGCSSRCSRDVVVDAAATRGLRSVCFTAAVTWPAGPGPARAASAVPSHWRDCHSAANPSTFSRCFNMDGEGVSVK